MVHVKWEKVKNRMDYSYSTKVRSVELGGAQWKIEAKPRQHGKVMGLDLPHLGIEVEAQGPVPKHKRAV